MMLETNVRSRRRSAPLLALLLLALAATAPAAEKVVVYKKDGGKVSGEVVEKTNAWIEVKTRFGRIKVERANILRLERVADDEKTFEARRAAIKDTDAKALIQLAHWAEKEKHYREAEATYAEAAEIAGPYYREAMLRRAHMNMRLKDYRQAIEAYQALAKRFRDEIAWKALQKAEEILHKARIEYWKRARLDHENGHYVEAIKAYTRALDHAIADEGLGEDDVGREGIYEALLRCRLDYFASVKTAWEYKPDLPPEELPPRIRDALNELSLAAESSGRISLMQPQMERITEVVANLGPLLPQKRKCDYGKGKIIRHVLKDFPHQGTVDEALAKKYAGSSPEGRQQFLFCYGLELAGWLNSSLTSLDRADLAWKYQPRPENLRTECRSVPFRTVRVEADRYEGRWIAVRGVYQGPSQWDETNARGLQISPQKHPELAVVVYLPGQKPRHAFLARQRDGEPRRYLAELFETYPYEEMKELLPTLAPGTKLVCYGRLLHRTETLPFHLLELWAIDPVQDPEALELAEYLKTPMRCDFQETPLADVVEFIAMITQAQIVFEGGEMPDLAVSLSASGQPAGFVVASLARECGLAWTRQGSKVLMKKKLTEGEEILQKQVLRLATDRGRRR